MLDCLLRKRRQQEPIVITEYVQKIHISNISVPKLLSSIFSPE